MDETCSAVAVGGGRAGVVVSEIIPGVHGRGRPSGYENQPSLGPVKGSQSVRSLPVVAKHCSVCVLSSAFVHLWKILTRLNHKRKKKVLPVTELFNMPDFFRFHVP